MEPVKPIRIPDLAQMKREGRRIVALTAYDATMGRLLDRAGVDIVLVGDSLGMVVMGYENTVPVTMEHMLHHTRSVTRGVSRSLVVVDLPFLTYSSTEEALHNAKRLLQVGRAAAVKLEGGRAVLSAVRTLVEFGIPVMGHLGLTPQSVHQLGGFGPQARTSREASRLIEEAKALEEAGSFSIVLESIPAQLARTVTESLEIPTIGIGAGLHCDGQVLVSSDLLGLYDEFNPPFVRRYAELGQVIVDAVKEFSEDVRSQRFPGAEETPLEEVEGDS